MLKVRLLSVPSFNEQLYFHLFLGSSVLVLSGANVKAKLYKICKPSGLKVKSHSYSPVSLLIFFYFQTALKNWKINRLTAPSEKLGSATAEHPTAGVNWMKINVGFQIIFTNKSHNSFLCHLFVLLTINQQISVIHFWMYLLFYLDFLTNVLISSWTGSWFSIFKQKLQLETELGLDVQWWNNKLQKKYVLIFCHKGIILISIV